MSKPTAPPPPTRPPDTRPPTKPTGKQPAGVFLDGTWRPRYCDPQLVLARRVHARLNRGGWRWLPNS